MNTSYKLALVATFCLALSVRLDAQTITTFGANASAGGDWAYDSGSSTVTAGTTNGGGLGFGISSLDIGSNDQIALTARFNLTDLSSPSFEVRLNSSGGSANAQFSFNDFNGVSAPSFVTVTSALVAGAGFQSDAVTSWQVLPGGTGSESVDMTFSSLSAVPEPSTVGLLLISGLGALALRRRRRA